MRSPLSSRKASRADALGFEYFLFRYNKSNIGYCGIKKKESELFLSKLYLHKNMRGKGIGKEVMAFLLKKCQDELLDSIVLTVNKNNASAIRAYEKWGFKVVDSFKKDIGNGFFMDDYLMKLFIA